MSKRKEQQKGDYRRLEKAKDAKGIALDRTQWKSFKKALCSTQGQKDRIRRGRTKAERVFTTSQSISLSYFFFNTIRPISRLRLCQRRSFLEVFGTNILLASFMSWCDHSKMFGDVNRSWSFSLRNCCHSPIICFFLITFFLYMPGQLLHVPKISHSIHRDTAHYDLLEMKREWTQMSVTGRGSVPLNYRTASQGEAGHNSLWGPVLWEGHQRTSHSRQKQQH